MNKTKRFLVVLAVVGMALAFLWPTLDWYFLTPKADQALALGSREQIREYARSMAGTDLETLVKNASANDGNAIDAVKYKVVIRAAKAALREAKKPDPKIWTAKTSLQAFNSYGSALESVSGIYRDAVLALKTKHGRAIQLGLDLSGGMSVVIQADMDALQRKIGKPLSAADKADAIDRAIEVLNSRIDKFGLTEPSIRKQGEDQIYVELPGAADPERISSIIMGRGRLAFYIVNSEATSQLSDYLQNTPGGIEEQTDSAGQKKQVVKDASKVPAGFIVLKEYKKDSYGLDEFTGRYQVVTADPGLDGTHIQSAQAVSNSLTGSPQIDFTLDKEGGDIFYKLTSANVKKPMAVVLDDRVKSVATINSPIQESGMIEGFGADEAQNLALLLRTAALPVELIPINQQAIGASLGEDAVRAGIWAITLAFFLVIGFMLAYYRGAGINTAIAEVVNLFIMIGVLSAFGLTLTLPSIAGFVLTIGISVDANVLINERIKEELRLGKGRAASIKTGFQKAFWTIFDSHMTNLISALFLAQLGSGPIQGFAVSLAIGTISSLFTSLFVSHLIFDFETDVMKLKTTSISWRLK
ncbi:MAG: protein translocase subunit SecD [Spirochaetota bacterium]